MIEMKIIRTAINRRVCCVRYFSGWCHSSRMRFAISIHFYAYRCPGIRYIRTHTRTHAPTRAGECEQVFDAARTFNERARILHKLTHTHIQPRQLILLGFFFTLLGIECISFSFWQRCSVSVAVREKKNYIRKIPWLWLCSLKMLWVRAMRFFFSLVVRSNVRWFRRLYVLCVFFLVQLARQRGFTIATETERGS